MSKRSTRPRRWSTSRRSATRTRAVPLPLAVVGRVKDGSAEAVRATGLTRVYLQANIHAGEVEGKEVLQMLLRDLALGRHPEWTRTMVLLIAPIYNADGNERIRLDQRSLQNGPLGGVGQRPNAQDLDLNRDHMKLESPEARSLVSMLRAYDPHLGVDLHTTNGTHHAYQLTYATPLHPNTAPALVTWLRSDWLPRITKRIKSKPMGGISTTTEISLPPPCRPPAAARRLSARGFPSIIAPASTTTISDCGTGWRF